RDNGAARRRRPTSTSTCPITTRRWRGCRTRRLVARLAVPHRERDKVAADREVAVIEHQRTGDAVLVDFELDRVDPRLVASLRGLVEIADRDRPALEPRERLLAGGRIGWRPLVRADHAADDAERLVDSLALVRAVVGRQLDDGFASACGLDDPPHVIGRE